MISWLLILPFVWPLSIYSRVNTPIKRKVETMTALLEKTKSALLHKSPWQHAYWQSPPAIKIALQDIPIQWQSLWGTQALPSTSCIMTPDWIWWWYFPQTIDTLSYFGHVTSDCSSSHVDCGYGRPSSDPLQWKHLRVFAAAINIQKLLWALYSPLAPCMQGQNSDSGLPNIFGFGFSGKFCQL